MTRTGRWLACCAPRGIVVAVDAPNQAQLADPAAPAYRPTCTRCRRPGDYCYCGLLPRLQTKTRVVFLQHPRESNVAIGTARMAHLALAGSRLIEGIHLDRHPEVEALCREEGVAVLFPGDDARPLDAWLPDPPKTLIVLDGTWWQAKKLLTLNPALAALPRLSYQPTTPGNYRIRKEPSEECLATIEAVSAVLGALEGDAPRFAGLLVPFQFMVDRQLEAAASNDGPRRRRKKGGSGALLTELLPVVDRRADPVVVYAEACFEAVLRPRRHLGNSTAGLRGFTDEELYAGEDVVAAFARFRAFCGPHPVLAAWGPYTRDLLVQEGEPQRGFIDLRALAARALCRSPGGIELGARALGVVATPTHRTRALRMLAFLEDTLCALLERARTHPEAVPGTEPRAAPR